LACGLAFAATASAAGNDQGNQPLSAQERKAMTDKIKQNHRNYFQPQTAAQAKASTVRRPDGSVSLKVPTELWNHLAVQRDGNGQLHVIEADGTAPAPTLVEGLDHE
jgi:hypothetical protein